MAQLDPKVLSEGLVRIGEDVIARDNDALLDAYFSEDYVLHSHLAHDSRQHAVSLLDALAFERAVDAEWTSPSTASEAARRHGDPPAKDPFASGRGRSVDVALTRSRQPSRRKV